MKITLAFGYGLHSWQKQELGPGRGKTRQRWPDAASRKQRTQTSPAYRHIVPPESTRESYCGGKPSGIGGGNAPMTGAVVEVIG